jgi:hypothetical protein
MKKALIAFAVIAMGIPLASATWIAAALVSF